MKNLILTAFILTLAISAFSQYRTDVGVYFGGANYLGEIGGKEQTRRNFILDMKIKETKTSFGAFFRHRFNDSYGVTASLTNATIAGDDKNTTNLARKERNLSFKNNIIELSGRGEYYFYSINDVGNHGRYWVNFRPYIFAGLGVFHHNPKTLHNGEWVKLRPLKTEGQQKKYSPINVSIPAGVGFYFTYKNRYRLSVEMAYRKTFTDYLDDVSSKYASNEVLESELAQDLSNRNDELNSENTQIDAENYLPGNKRGDETNKDSFLTGQVGISYVLRGPWHVEVKSRGDFVPKMRIYRAKF